MGGLERRAVWGVVLGAADAVPSRLRTAQQSASSPSGERKMRHTRFGGRKLQARLNTPASAHKR